VIEAEVAIGHAAQKFDEDRRLVDETVRESLAEALAALVAEASPALVVAA
jgi:hypothetical protein